MMAGIILQACTIETCSPSVTLPAPRQDKLGSRILGQILYVMQSSNPSGKQRIAVALSQLTTRDQPSGAQLKLIFLEKKGMEVLLEMVQVRRAGGGEVGGGWVAAGRAGRWGRCAKAS